MHSINNPQTQCPQIHSNKGPLVILFYIFYILSLDKHTAMLRPQVERALARRAEKGSGMKGAGATVAPNGKGTAGERLRHGEASATKLTGRERSRGRDLFGFCLPGSRGRKKKAHAQKTLEIRGGREGSRPSQISGI